MPRNWFSATIKFPQALFFTASFHSFKPQSLFLSLTNYSYLSNSFPVPSELYSMVCKLHYIFNFLSEHCLYLPTLTKNSLSIEYSTSADEGGCLFLHNLNTLRLMIHLPIVMSIASLPPCKKKSLLLCYCWHLAMYNLPSCWYCLFTNFWSQSILHIKTATLFSLLAP